MGTGQLKQFINFSKMDIGYASALYRVCCWLACRMFTLPSNHTSYNNTLYIYGEPGAGKSYIIKKIS